MPWGELADWAIGDVAESEQIGDLADDVVRGFVAVERGGADDDVLGDGQVVVEVERLEGATHLETTGAGWGDRVPRS